MLLLIVVSLEGFGFLVLLGEAVCVNNT